MLFDMYGAIPGGIQAWESVAGISSDQLRKMYYYGSDRDRMKDFTDGRVTFGVNVDHPPYFQVVLRDYLRHRDEASLFTRDKILDLILQLPTTLGTASQSGDPLIRIEMAHSVIPEGTRVVFKVVKSWKLRNAHLRCRWEFSDGQVLSGQTVERIFPASGRHKVTVIANDGQADRVRTLSFATRLGPGDLGLKRWPQGIRIQAEEFVAQGGGGETEVRVRTDKLGADGGCFSHWNDMGRWVEWNVTVPRSGDYYLLVKYARPEDGERTVSLDGKHVGTIRLPSSGGYGSSTEDDWAVELLRDEQGKPQPVHIAAGTHVLRLTNVDGKGCNLDYVELLPAGG